MDSNKGNIRITYESLFELLRNEKNREELQKLDPNFFKNITEYLKEKKSILNQSEDNMFVKSEKQKTLQQISNIQRIIKDLYQRREKKIISMALIKSRVHAKVDESTLLKEEKLIFENLINLFDNFRDNVLNNILEGQKPDTETIKQNLMGKPKEKHDQKDITQIQKDETEKQEINMMIRFTQYVPSFLGTDLNIYGPFEPEDIACLPNKITKLIITKKAGEEMK